MLYEDHSDRAVTSEHSVSKVRVELGADPVLVPVAVSECGSKQRHRERTGN